MCLIDDKPAVLVCELPDEENDQFQLRLYGFGALKQTYNQGMVFNDFPVPAGRICCRADTRAMA